MKTVLANLCYEAHVSMTYYDFKILMEHYESSMADKGLSIFYSMMIAENRQVMLPLNAVVNAEMHERFDPLQAKHAEYEDKLDELKRKYVDRDAQGEPIVDDISEPVITEMKVEFEKAVAELNAAYSDVVNLDFQAAVNAYLMDHQISFMMLMPNDIQKLPDALQPAIVEIYYKLL